MPEPPALIPYGSKRLMPYIFQFNTMADERAGRNIAVMIDRCDSVAGSTPEVFVDHPEIIPGVIFTTGRYDMQGVFVSLQRTQCFLILFKGQTQFFVFKGPAYWVAPP